MLIHCCDCFLLAEWPQLVPLLHQYFSIDCVTCQVVEVHYALHAFISNPVISSTHGDLLKDLRFLAVSKLASGRLCAQSQHKLVERLFSLLLQGTKHLKFHAIVPLSDEKLFKTFDRVVILWNWWWHQRYLHWSRYDFLRYWLQIVKDPLQSSAAVRQHCYQLLVLRLDVSHFGKELKRPVPLFPFSSKTLRIHRGVKRCQRPTLSSFLAHLICDKSKKKGKHCYIRVSNEQVIVT